MKALLLTFLLAAMGCAALCATAGSPADARQPAIEAATPKLPSLRVGVVIPHELLHPADGPNDGGAVTTSNRAYLVRAVKTWMSEFPQKAGGRATEVKVVEIGKDPPKFSGFNLLVLMPCWAYQSETTKSLDTHAAAFHDYVRHGGGLLVFQPNPMDNYPEKIADDFAHRGLANLGLCTPKLLPLPATFCNTYIDGETVKRTTAVHPITQGLMDSQMPFPADRIVDLGKGYTVLARGETSNSPSLAAATVGKGRVVLIMCNIDGETVSKQGKAHDVVARSILWAGGCGDREVMAVGGR